MKNLFYAAEYFYFYFFFMFNKVRAGFAVQNC